MLFVINALLAPICHEKNLAQYDHKRATKDLGTFVYPSSVAFVYIALKYWAADARSKGVERDKAVGIEGAAGNEGGGRDEGGTDDDDESDDENQKEDGVGGQQEGGFASLKSKAQPGRKAGCKSWRDEEILQEYTKMSKTIEERMADRVVMGRWNQWWKKMMEKVMRDRKNEQGVRGPPRRVTLDPPVQTGRELYAKYLERSNGDS